MSVRILPGLHRSTATDGTTINVDRPLSREQTDLLVGVIQHTDRCPSCTAWVELMDDGPPVAKFLERTTRCTHA